MSALVAERPSYAPLVPAWTQHLAVEPVSSEPGPDEHWDDEPVAGDPIVRPGETAPVPLGLVAPEATDVVDMDASPAPAPAPATKRKPAPRPRRQPNVAAVEPIAPLAEQIAPLAEALPAHDADSIVNADSPSLPADPIAPAEPPLPLQPVPGWPPPGDLGIMPEPPARVLAGAYLPPSAVLPSAEGVSTADAANGRGGASTSGMVVASTGSDRAPTSAADRLAMLGLPSDTPRRIVAIGAVVAGLGFLLPWTPMFPGDSLIGDYTARWGLAGPGHWIVAGLLVGLAAVSLASGRLATLRVGLAGIVLSALLLGLTWPYLFAFVGRAVGLWIILGGLGLLVAGGLIEVRTGRHDRSHPTV
jgi:hypothetical protein